MTSLLRDERTVAVSGTVDNQGEFADRFEHVVLLSAPLDVLLARVSSRTGNPYGRTAQQQAEIARYQAEVDPLLRGAASVELDGRADPAALVDAVERLLVGPAPVRR